MSIMLKCFLFVILTSFVECRRCVDRIYYYPCRCLDFLSPEIINCLSVEHAAKLYRALNGNLNESVHSFIKDDESESIGEKIFGDVPVAFANFQMAKLKYLSNSSFNGQENTMEMLDFHARNLDYIPYQGKMMKLKSFWFGNNRVIPIVKKSWFSGIQNGKVLQRLDLSWNVIQSIENYAFFELVALRYLDLDNNQLSALDPSIVATNVPLTELSIKSNRLRQLPEDFLKLLPYHAVIKISENNVTDISADILEVISEKEFKIDIYENPLICDCKWLPFINGSLTKEWKTLITGECKVIDSTEMANIFHLKPKDFSGCN